VSGDAEAFEMTSDTSGPSGANGPVVEDNGPWFVVFMVGLVLLFTAGVAAVIRSLVATF